MLPNHAPIVIAEHYGTLSQLYNGRIDLGLGRAPGTDDATASALRRLPASADTFPRDVLELQAYFSDDPGQVQAVPATGTKVPLWILGSSTYGAQLAAHLGLPFAFAAHFSPGWTHDALDIYRGGFKPSAQCAEPYSVVCVNIIAAESDAEARFLATTQQMSIVDMFRGNRDLSKAPIADIEGYWTASEKVQAERILAGSIIGSPDTVRAGISKLVSETGADELMILTDIWDLSARRRAIEIIADCNTAQASSRNPQFSDAD